MRIKFLNFTAIALMVLFAACSKEELITDINTETVRTLSLTASMPVTRVALAQDENKIAVSWEEGDKIQLLFVQEANNASVTATVDRVSNDGKKAHFEIPIPEGANGQFTLYGVYGGGGIYAVNDTIAAVLPENPGSVTLAENQTNVMLYFETSMQATDEETSVSFQHIGSLFNISINNITQNTIDFLGANNIAEVRLVGKIGPTEWAFNDYSGQYFDLVSKEFKHLPATPPGNYISFKNGSPITNGKTTFWGWYPPLSENKWPELELELRNSDGSFILTSTNTLPTRANAPVAGMSYNFYASFNVSNEISFVPEF